MYFMVEKNLGLYVVHSKIRVDVGKLAQPEKRHSSPTRDFYPKGHDLNLTHTLHD